MKILNSLYSNTFDIFPSFADSLVESSTHETFKIANTFDNFKITEIVSSYSIAFRPTVLVDIFFVSAVIDFDDLHYRSRLVSVFRET